MQFFHTFSAIVKAIDCGVPIGGNGVVFEPFNSTKFDAVVTFHCEESLISMVAVCDSKGEWMPKPSSFKCLNGTLGNQA